MRLDSRDSVRICFWREKNMSRTASIDIDADGRLHLPKPIATRLGLVSGSTLEVVHAGEDGARLRVVQNRPQLRSKGGIMVVTGELIGDTENAVNRDREERMRVAAAWK